MHTRSKSRNLRHQQHQAPPSVVKPFNLEEPIENPDPLAPMDDSRTMAQLLEAPTAGYEDFSLSGDHKLGHDSSSTNMIASFLKLRYSLTNGYSSSSSHISQIIGSDSVSFVNKGFPSPKGLTSPDPLSQTLDSVFVSSAGESCCNCENSSS
ncbi:hypothetical protein Tco_0551777 [Tanacetum coccineum]